MLRNPSALPAIAGAPASFDDVAVLAPQTGAAAEPKVAVSPSAAAGRRQCMSGRGMAVELMLPTSRDRIEFRYRGSWHLLVACEQGVRREGETFVDGARPSTLRDAARKLTFVPAGSGYFEWHRLHTSARILFIHLDPAVFDVGSEVTASGGILMPRVFFEDPTLWSTVLKLSGLVEGAGADGVPYFEALGMVLTHELSRSNSGTGHCDAARGGLAAWQQRLVAAYIEEHLGEHIPLSSLARLARLSPYHFSRAFKRSFGVPPHRYHTNRRMERAKTLLARHSLSVTDIGLSLGFSETSSFTAAFRKATGLTPTRYHRGTAGPPVHLGS